MSSNIDKDQENASEWLNAQFFNAVLQSYEHDNKIKVNNVSILPASAVEDHYSSLMFRVIVNYCNAKGLDKKISLIIKTIPETEGYLNKMLNESNVFETEICMNAEVIPKLEQVLRAAGEEVVLGAPYVYHSLSPRKVIIFEDICPRGYEMQRYGHANMEQARAAYAKIAKWHAASYKILKENPTYFDKYRHNFMTINEITKQDYMNDSLDFFIDLLQRVTTLNQYKPYFVALRSNYLKQLRDTFCEYQENKQSNGYYVLCHGDLHLKNIMLKYNKSNSKNNLEDILILDYQYSFVGPMAIDMLYSFYLLMNEELRLHHRDELIYFYFNTFLETLKKLKVAGELPSLLEFRRQLVQHRNLELFCLYTFLPMWYAYKMDKNEELQTEHDKRRHLYTNPFYIEELHKILPHYLHLGYFEFDKN